MFSNFAIAAITTTSPAATGTAPAPADTIRDDVLVGIFIAWLVLSIWAMIKGRIFAGKLLRAAPPRQSTLSLPVVGGVLLLYIIMLAAASLLAVATHLVPADAFRESAATAPVAPSLIPPTPTLPPASASAAAPAPAAATIPTTSAATAAATADDSLASSAPPTPPPPVAARDYTIIEQAVGGTAELLTVGLFAVFAAFFFRDGYRGWGLAPSQIAPGVRAGVIGFLMAFPLLIASELLSQWFIQAFLNRKMYVHPTLQELQLNPPLFDRISLFLLAVAVAPLAEEIFFRGILQTALIQHGWGFLVPQVNPRLKPPPDRRPPVHQRWAAIGIASLAFAAVHPADHFLVILLLALSLGYVYERTGNLWAAITLHALFNGASFWLSS